MSNRYPRPTMTEADAREIMTNAYPYGDAADMAADASALAELAADPMLSPALFGLAKLSADVNTLEMRRFMIGYARSRGLSAGRWRSMADQLPRHLLKFA